MVDFSELYFLCVPITENASQRVLAHSIVVNSVPQARCGLRVAMRTGSRANPRCKQKCAESIATHSIGLIQLEIR